MITARGIVRTFPARGGLLGRAPVTALAGVDFDLPDGGAVSIIGESGCGKSTLARIVCGMESFDGGTLSIAGQDVGPLSAARRAELFRRAQMVHQDPYSALNPTRTVRQALEDPLRLRAKQTRRDKRWVRDRTVELLRLVGLEPAYCLPRYPHMLSGGMRQRVVIARALTVDPSVLVADEAIAMIDVSLRLGILALFTKMRSELGLSVLFISHDVAAARYVGEGNVLYVLYRGQVVECGPIEEVVESPIHPYTQSLLSAIPVLKGLEVEGRERIVPLGVLDEDSAPQGCLFSDRCPFAEDDCRSARPDLMASGDEAHRHACFHPKVRRVVATQLSTR